MSEHAAARPPRWRPSRAGIRNIWEYDDQVFHFADGRLILRGPNGSGKSNALALLVPFLLDGVMAASRMDSLSGGRSMKTLLLCLADDERAGRFRHEQRTGYAWLELEHGDHHVTIGCGARASTQREAEAWFFVASSRPGIDLDLAPGGIPLSRGALAEALGAGAVHDSAEGYRAAIDRALFGLGAHRYRNLVELLLVLRRPHLAGKLNLEHLSKVMSDGLAALDDRMIADVAASFEDLEAVQRDLRRLQEAHRTVHAFLPTYRRYLRAVARTRAGAALNADQALRGAGRRVADAAKALASADQEVERVRVQRLSCDERREIAGQRQRAVLESPAYRDAVSLVEVEGRAADAEQALEQAADRLVAAAEEAGAAADALGSADIGLREASTGVDQEFSATGEAADLAGVAWSLARGEVESGELERMVRSLAVRRRQDVADVREAHARFERASIQASATAAAAARSAEEAETADEARRSSAAAVDSARAALVGEVEEWARDSDVPELDAVVLAAELVGEPQAPSLNDALADALEPRRADLVGRGARAEDQAAQLSGERDVLEDERRRVADDPVPAPDRLATRPANRAGRTGAPLYACCDFADHVAEDDRAGLEAALEAAGLLDAWMGEAGDDLDAWLRPLPPVPAPSLADVLVPTPAAGSGLTADAVHEVLRSVALSDAGVAVLQDGQFRLGLLTGRFAKPAAEFIGVTAREHRRQRLLDELDERIAGLTRRLAAVAREREGVAAGQAHLDRLAASLPSAGAVLAARDVLLGAVARARATGEAAYRDEELAREARRVAETEGARLRAVAAERRLPATPEGLNGAESAVSAYEQRAHGLLQAVNRLAGRGAAREQAAGRAARAEEAVSARTAERDALHRKASGLTARVEQLRTQLGADAETPLRELDAVEAELRRLETEGKALSDAASAAAERRGGADMEQALAQDAIAGRRAAAVEATEHLEVLRRGDVWAAVVSADVSPPDVAELAAAVSAATADVTATADDNGLQRAYRQLLDELGRGYDPGLAYVDGVAVVEVTSDAGTFSVLWLAEELTNQVARQQELLSERDREIFERHLLTRVSEALRELLNDAEDLVDRINRSLADRPTASGKTVQLRWELDSGDPAVRRALALLRKTPELLGPDEREQLRRFFSTAIAQRRAEDAASSYAEILRQVLDYRAWHVFVPHVRSAGGGVQRLTRTLFRSLSGGEQAVVLHLPLFAAAAAHYDAAEPAAPRLIALDEAFAGIDEGMRADLMGLLVRFDLDVLLTGHELWGAYEQVPSLMVYDLLRHPPMEGVSAFALRWDGAAMAEV